MLERKTGRLEDATKAYISDFQRYTSKRHSALHGIYWNPINKKQNVYFGILIALANEEKGEGRCSGDEPGSTLASWYCNAHESHLLSKFPQHQDAFPQVYPHMQASISIAQKRRKSNAIAKRMSPWPLIAAVHDDFGESYLRLPSRSSRYASSCSLGSNGL